MQLGVPVDLELFYIARLNCEQRSLPVGLGKLKSAGRLLDVVSHLSGDGFKHVGGAGACIEIHGYDDDRQQHGRRCEDATQTIDLERHLGSV